MSEASSTTASGFFDETPDVPERALRIYARLWQFETWIRSMVYVELRVLLGDGWSAGLSAKAHSFEADKRLTHMPTPELNALSYAQLSQLTTLIGTHWPCFECYLPPRELWDAKLVEICQIRHRIAHFRVGHVDDLPRLLQFLRDIDRGFWTFATSYNDAHPVLPASRDAVTHHFLHLDPLPWCEVEPNQWARVGMVDKSQGCCQVNGQEEIAQIRTLRVSKGYSLPFFIARRWWWRCRHREDLGKTPEILHFFAESPLGQASIGQLS